MENGEMTISGDKGNGNADQWVSYVNDRELLNLGDVILGITTCGLYSDCLVQASTESFSSPHTLPSHTT